MLIRSQNKIGIVNLNQVDTIVYDDRQDVIFAYNPGNTPMDLGEYTTKAKAIKVLDIIQSQYQYIQECRYIGVGCSQPEFVFQMPQDDEVEA